MSDCCAAEPVLVCADAWKSRWVESKHKSDYGRFVLTAGKFYGDAEKDKGEWKGETVSTHAVNLWITPTLFRVLTML